MWKNLDKTNDQQMNRVKIICSCSKILFLHERLSQNDPEIRFLNSGALICIFCDSEENKNKTFRVKSQKSEKTSRNIKFTVRLFCLLMVNKQTNMEVQLPEPLRSRLITGCGSEWIHTVSLLLHEPGLSRRARVTGTRTC